MPRTPSDRFSPTIMHAFRAAFEARDSRKPLDLRDEHGERVVASRRLPSRYGMRESIVRGELARDLSDLLNTINLGSCEDLSDLPHVRRSVLNFGIADASRIGVERQARETIAAEIAAVLAAHEPRLAPNSIQVVAQNRRDRSDHKLSFLITAELISSPVNLGIEFVADLDYEASAFSIRKLTPQ